MGLITTKKSLLQCEKVTVSAFCRCCRSRKIIYWTRNSRSSPREPLLTRNLDLPRRRLPVVMSRLKMAETMKESVTFVEQGHVRVGPTTVTDPAMLVTRSMEDFVTWTDTSKIRRKIKEYNNEADDYELMGN